MANYVLTRLNAIKFTVTVLKKRVIKYLITENRQLKFGFSVIEIIFEYDY